MIKRLSIRPARPGDLAQFDDLLAATPHVHMVLDWWGWDDWVGAPTFVVAEDGGRVRGLSLAICDRQPVIWWRALAIANGYLSTLLQPLLTATLTAARQQGADTLASLVLAGWLEHQMPQLQFKQNTQIMTLRKDDPQLPPSNPGPARIRPATPADTPAVLAVDHLAFSPLWRYGEREMAAMWPCMQHIMVAEIHDRLVGYASGDMHQTNGHIVRLAVDPAYQRLGIGAGLLANMIQALYTAGAPAVTLNTQTNNLVSQKLYHRFNFHQIGYTLNVWEYPLVKPDHSSTRKDNKPCGN